MDRLPPIAVLSDNHYVIEDFKERFTTKEWKSLLLNDRDTIIVKGHVRKLKAKNIGCGVVEVSKMPLEKDLLGRTYRK